MLKRSIYLILLLLPFFAKAQKNEWRIGVNPLSIFEPQATIGPSAEYFISNRFSLWAEAGVIVKGNYLNPGRTNLTGYRFIFQPRYYLGESKTAFIAPEFRLKHFRYGFTGMFINKNTSDTISSLQHTAVQTLAGGALIVGKQLQIGKNFMLEITAGIGARYRNIDRRPVPAGYGFYLQPGGFGLRPHYEWDGDGAAYFPIGIRMLWCIGNGK